MKRSRFKYKPPAEGSRRDLKETLDALTRRVVLAQETICFTCHQPGTDADPLECSHLFTRTWPPTRFDVHLEGNNHAQHKSENNRHEYEPEIYRDEFVRRFGQNAYDSLETRAHAQTKFGAIDLCEMIEEREEMLNATVL